MILAFAQDINAKNTASDVLKDPKYYFSTPKRKKKTPSIHVPVLLEQKLQNILILL